MTTLNAAASILADSHTLWLGDIETWMDEPFIAKVFGQLGYGGTLTSIKIIKDKGSDQPSGYGFLQFNNKETAQHVLSTFNGTQIPGTHKHFKLNWAIYGGGTKTSDLSASKSSHEISLYVGGLDYSVTGPMLTQFFKSKYPSVYSAKVISDPLTKFSKGYGFVMFHNNEQAQKALAETNGLLLAGKMIKVSAAFNKTATESQVSAPTATVQLAQEIEAQNLSTSQKQQLYEYYISLINDPVMKLEYQRQLQLLYGIDPRQMKKKNLKSQLEQIPILDYKQTQNSEEYLHGLIAMQKYSEKSAMEDFIFR